MMFSSPHGIQTTRFLSACLQTALLLMSVFHTGISSVKADVRCYCNLPVCVTSGYMCKSPLGVCISDHFGFSDDLWQSRHACIELISDASQQVEPLKCPNTLQGVEIQTYPTRLCCREDMCNYFRNNLDPQDPVYRLNHSYMTGYLSNEDYFYRHSGNNNNNSSKQQQVWFKAAVIAVPIAGGCILIMLIIMAARMLKADHKRYKEWTELRRRNRMNTHVVYTGEKHISHSLLMLPKSISSAVLGNHSADTHLNRSYTSMGSIGQPSSLYKNVSIALSNDTDCTDGSKDKYFVFDL
ncbi:BMP and activin membrane-bound inhibitor homolog [Uloborus diversus]|uniref:BMP and activin membrane-bound inhibitor homolog n=1 Tax=Uloborus diversus TaxID=327109 RepID=UPI00240A8031|nr:BMP and activin membrane-bound inhibitor homolog [Uloborus diversus]